MQRGLVGSEMCIRDRYQRRVHGESQIQSESLFTGAMLVFLSTMTMVTLSDHIMVMWIAIEATTLASAPLIYTHRSAASLEATWKYVLICSVGIAMALLGSVLVAFSMGPVSYTHLTLPTILLVQISVVAVSLKKKKNLLSVRAGVHVSTQRYSRVMTLS
eukprot:TRINITY_DN55100_c0_g1_i2.p1 TRINITY_DN55100_c0_g1~~TRINITY_DN55100_c0_g1_i2.p1  ORF type:complete len:160 (-),score=50.98 TRINITY_DN55100_c0_g1_i2:7-486(-)